VKGPLGLKQKSNCCRGTPGKGGVEDRGGEEDDGPTKKKRAEPSPKINKDVAEARCTRLQQESARGGNRGERRLHCMSIGYGSSLARAAWMPNSSNNFAAVRAYSQRKGELYFRLN